MKKRSLFMITLLLISMLALGSIAWAQDATVTIDFWQTDSAPKITGMENVIAGFEALHPEIDVVQTVVPYDDYQTKIAASVPAGTGPDVAMIYFGWAPLWSKSGFIIPLPESLQTALDEDFVPFTQVTKLNDEHYAVPTSVRNFALVYNVGLLAEAGWDAPPDTWDEFAQAAQACTKYDDAGNITQAGYYLEWDGDGWNWWRPLAQAYGGMAFSDDARTALWNQGGAVEAFQYMLDFTLTLKTSTPGFFAGEPDAFAAGLTCMTPQLTFILGFLRSNAAPEVDWAIAPMPEGPEGRFTTGSSWPLALTTKAATDPAKLEAATLFLEYMASAEAQEFYTDATGELPARLDMLDLEKYTSDPDLAPFIEQLPQTTGVFWADELAERQCAVDMYDAVIVGGSSVEDAVNMGTECDQAIRDAFFVDWES
ncbi:MAG: extracellular solute-binding protein [Anaerolineae bacterium]|nr:extracellular solute-binding protein [Anaerolineae bacterium]